jgi:uncharacterized protein with beta-barrel porin domain
VSGLGFPFGGGGGGGGFNGNGMGAATIANTSVLSGGHGGAGAIGVINRISNTGPGGGGGGGAGGYGAIVTGSGVSTNSAAGSISGGSGGNGGGGGATMAGGSSDGGNGGDGGVGVQLTTSGATFANSGTVTGGNGGTGGTVTSGATGNAGAAGAGGAGIVGGSGGGLTVINSGSITGGMSGVGVQANAITFTSGAMNTLQLQSGSTISGKVVGTGSDLLQLGATSSTGTNFDASQVGATAQYQGFGSFQKVGTSTWTLTGTNSNTMAWAVNAGTLAVTGMLANSMMTVGNGATLTGTGSVGATTVNMGGTFAPGSGTAGSTINVNGNLILSTGATYMVQVSPAAASMANVTGTATLTGASVQTVFAAGTFMTKTYTILSSNGLGGTVFTGVNSTSLPSGFTETVANSTDGKSVTLNLTASLGGGGSGGGSGSGGGNGGGSGSGGGGAGAGGGNGGGANSLSGGLNTNQQNIANALNSFFNNGGALPPAFVNVFGLTGTNLGNALSQLSGEAATGAQQGASALMTEFLELVLDPFVYGQVGNQVGGVTAHGFAPERQALPDDLALAYAQILKSPATKAPGIFEQRWNVWASGFGGQNTTRGDATVGSHDLTASAGGGAAGADYHLSRDSVIGFALAGAGTNWSLSQGLGGGRSDAFQAGIYGATRSGPAYLAGTLAFANHWVTTDRIALGDQLTAKFNAQSFGGRAEGGYRFAVPFGGISPYAALQATSFHTPTYSETDLTGVAGGGFGLTFQRRNATDTRAELGARFDHAELVSPDQVLTLRGRLAWAHDWDSNPALTAAFQALPGASFIVNGATQASDLALVTAGAELAFRSGISLSGKFEGEFANRVQTYAGTATVRYRW